MPKKQNTRRKRSRNSNRRGSRAVRKQPSLFVTAPDLEQRYCACPLHESFLVPVGSKQVYALPACRKREHDRIKKVAFRQFMYDGLRRLGVSMADASTIAQKALRYYYTRFVRMWRQLGWVYSPEKVTWVKA